LWSWRYAYGHKLTKGDVSPEISAAVERRIVSYQVAYAIAAAIGLTPAGTLVSIGLIVLIQLNSAIAPRIPFLSRL
jgi:hypothetical protein